MRDLDLEKDYYDKEPATLCDMCKHKHSPDDDCADDYRCVLSGCDRRATKSHFSDTDFQYCNDHFNPADRADND